MRSGIAIIAIDIGGLFVILNQGINGLLLPRYDNKSFATFLKRRLNKFKILNEFGDNIRKI